MSLHRDGLSNLRESHPQPERARITEVQMYQGDQYDTVSKAHHAPLGPFGGRSAALRRRKRQPRRATAHDQNVDIVTEAD